MPYLAAGESNREIAVALSLTQHTVEKYVSELMEILGVHGRGHLVVACQELAEAPSGGFPDRDEP